MCNFRLLQGLRSAVVDNIWRRIVGVMFPPSIFERSMHWLSKIDVSTFEYRCVALRRSMSRCVDLRRSMCRLSKIDVSTFGDGCVDLRRPMIDVSTFEDRWLMCRPSKIDESMCRPSNIDGRCEIRLLYLIKILILYIAACELRRGFALQCFHYYCFCYI